MRIEKKFAPKTIIIDTKEDEEFILDMLKFAQEYLYSKNRWNSGSTVRMCDKEMYEKLNYFKKLIS